MLPFMPGGKMGYAEKNLAPGETIIHRARYHWIIYRAALVTLALALCVGAAAIYAARTSPDASVARLVAWLAAGLLAVAVLMFLLRSIRASADEYVVTSGRVIRKVGLVSREIEQASLEKIQDITIEQGSLGRLLDFGTVILETASERGTLLFPGIAGPEAFRNAVWGQVPPSGAVRPARQVRPGSSAAGGAGEFETAGAGFR